MLMTWSDFIYLVNHVSGLKQSTHTQSIQRDAKDVPKRGAKKKCQKEVCQRDAKAMLKRCKRVYNQSIQPEHTKRSNFPNIISF